MDLTCGYSLCSLCLALSKSSIVQEWWDVYRNPSWYNILNKKFLVHKYHIPRSEVVEKA